MKRFFVTACLIVVLLANVAPALAQTALNTSASLLDSAAGEATANNPNAPGLTKDLSGLIASIVKGVLGFVGTGFLVLVIYAGILWMTASGKEEQVESAKKIITAAVIGVGITMAAYTITYFITARLKTVGEGPPLRGTPPRAVVCGQEPQAPKGTCRKITDCGNNNGTAIVGSSCGPDTSFMCCSK